MKKNSRLSEKHDCSDRFAFLYTIVSSRQKVCLELVSNLLCKAANSAKPMHTYSG